MFIHITNITFISNLKLNSLVVIQDEKWLLISHAEEIRYVSLSNRGSKECSCAVSLTLCDDHITNTNLLFANEIILHIILNTSIKFVQDHFSAPDLLAQRTGHFGKDFLVIYDH